MSIFQFENNQPLSGYPQNNPTGLPVPSVSPPVMPPPCWGSTDESYSRRYDTRTPSSAFPNNGFAGAIPPNPPPVSITPPISPPPNWGGTSRRNCGSTILTPKDYKQTYELDAGSCAWYSAQYINGLLRKRVPLTSAVTIQLVVNIVDHHGNLLYVAVQYFTDAVYSVVFSAANFRAGKYIQNMENITRLPGCTKRQANDLIEFLMISAPSIQLTLYSHQGFVEQPDGSMMFAANPGDFPIPESYIPESLRIRSLKPLPQDLTAANRLWFAIKELHQQIRLLLLLRAGSLIRYYLDLVNITPNTFISVTPSIEIDNEKLHVLLSTNDIRLHQIPMLDENLKKMEAELDLVWDGIAVFADHSLADEGAKREEGLRFLIREAAGNTGHGRNTIVLISPYAAYDANKIAAESVLSVSMKGVTLDADRETVSQMVSLMDSIIIHSMQNATELSKAAFIERHKDFSPYWCRHIGKPLCDLAPFLMAAEHFLNDFCNASLLSNEELLKLLDNIYDESITAISADQIILKEISAHLSEQLHSGRYTIIPKKNQMRIDLSKENVISDGSWIYISKAMLQEVVHEMPSLHGQSGVLNALRQNGALNATDGDTHPIQTYDINGNPVRLFWYALSAEILSADVLHMIRNLDSEQFWFAPDEVPERDFLPLLRDASGRVAGKLIRQQDAENNHIYLTGQSGAGKTYEEDQLMAMKRALRHNVVTFDSSGSTDYEAMCCNLSKDFVDENVIFIDVDTDGIPVDLFRINRDATKPTQKKALRGILTAGVGELSAPQKNRLSSVLSDMLDLIDKSEPIRPCDILAMLQEDGATYESLRSRFEPLLEDIDALGMASQSWGEVFQQNTGKIIVIRTASGSAEHGDQLIDMMLASLFSYQKENHDVPLDIFIDELQNQNLSTDSPIYQIMKEGRKDGIAFAGATQDFYPFNTELGKIMSKADMQIILRPTPNSANAVAANLRFKKGDEAWFDTMLRGDAIIKGWFYSKIEQRNIPRTLSGRLASFIERDADDDVSQND